MKSPSSQEDCPPSADELRDLLMRLSGLFIRAGQDDLDHAIREALATLGRHAGVSACFLFEFDKAMNSASKHFEWCDQGVASTTAAFTGVTAASMPTLFPPAAAGDTLRFNALSEMPGDRAAAERDMLASLNVAAFMCVPVRVQQQVVGLLGLDQRQAGRVWTDDEAALLRLSADMFAQALDRRRTHNRLGFHINNAPLGVIEWDDQWHVQRWSPKAEQMFGWSADEVLGQSWADWPFVHEEDRPSVQAVSDRLVNGIENSNVSVNRNYTRDRRVMTCEWFNSVLRDESGRVISILSFVQDITQRRADERALAASREALQMANKKLEYRVELRTAELRESEVRYRTLAEHATDMISCHDADGRFTYVSPASRRLLGVAPEQLIGTMPRDIAHPDDRDAVIQSLARLRETTDVVSITFRAQRRDGSTIWLESSSRSDGQEIVVVSRDVTARLDAEQRLRLIQSAVDQVREAVVITDNQLSKPGPHIIYVNPAFTDMTGYHLEEVVGCSPRILQGPRTNAELLIRLRDALARGQTFVGETINYRKNGSEYAVEWAINPLRDPQGHTSHWVAIQRDITARQTSEQLARVHRDQLSHVTRLSTMGEMASGLAHEINQPLTAIQNYVNGALRRIDSNQASPQEVGKVLRHVADQSERAGQIIRRIRGFVSKRGTVRSTENVNALVEETLALLEADIHDRRARVSLDLAADLPPVDVDGIQIEQVLVNVIRNGLESMDQNDPPQRVLEIATLRETPGVVTVTIADRGSGLSDFARDHLFDPYFSTKDQGMGMGLTISQSIVQAHGGQLWVTPNHPAGSVFHLTLPATIKASAPGQTGPEAADAD